MTVVHHALAIWRGRGFATEYAMGKLGEQWFDNTDGNPNNPDPDQWVDYGSRTADEMSHFWMAVTHLDEEGYEALVAEREAAEEARRIAASN